MTNNVTIIKVDICININMNIEIDYSFKSKIDELNKIYKISKNKFEDNVLDKNEFNNHIYEVNAIFDQLFKDIFKNRYMSGYNFNSSYFNTIKSAIFFLDFIHELKNLDFVSEENYKRFHKEIIINNLELNNISFKKFEEIKNNRKLLSFFEEKDYSILTKHNYNNSIYTRFNLSNEKNEKMKKEILDKFLKDSYLWIIDEMYKRLTSNSKQCTIPYQEENTENEIYEIFKLYFKAIKNVEVLDDLI